MCSACSQRRVEPGLARLLLDTDLPKITGEQFQLPFPVIFLEFPARLFVLEQFQAPVIGCYLIDLRPVADVVSLDFVIEPTKNGPAHRECVLNVKLAVAKDKFVNWGDMRKQILSDLKVGLMSAANERQQSFAEKFAGFADELSRFVVNSVLYATSQSADLIEEVGKWRQTEQELDTAKGKRKDKLVKELGGLARTNKSVLGRTIIVQYGSPRANETSEQAREHRRVLKRFEVRGHWHWYLHGPGKTERVHKLIRPFWKGPKDVAELLRRKYQLK